ncbi:Plasmodium exported protein (PHIST), unknown function [Plasmodium vivax]|uniref:Plasmodium RESA N-terminal domain-containing protein n=1 Tax=Plasmodium vivax TaxID=5855 RepID=A0A564ZS31_PLAVI|nr:Plasmodium exported protein (PHIST), unknown function [Plasmodium vivax]
MAFEVGANVRDVYGESRGARRNIGGWDDGKGKEDGEHRVGKISRQGSKREGALFDYPHSGEEQISEGSARSNFSVVPLCRALLWGVSLFLFPTPGARHKGAGQPMVGKGPQTKARKLASLVHRNGNAWAGGSMDREFEKAYRSWESQLDRMSEWGSVSSLRSGVGSNAGSYTGSYAGSRTDMSEVGMEDGVQDDVEGYTGSYAGSNAGSSAGSRTDMSEVGSEVGVQDDVEGYLDDGVADETPPGEPTFFMTAREMSAMFARVQADERKKFTQMQQNLKSYCERLAIDYRVPAHYAERQCYKVQKETTDLFVRKEKLYLRNLRKMAKKGQFPRRKFLKNISAYQMQWKDMRWSFNNMWSNHLEEKMKRYWLQKENSIGLRTSFNMFWG